MVKARFTLGMRNPFFRHSIRDQLIVVEYPADIIDAIGGWSTEGVGQHHGVGFDLKLESKWMKKLTYD